jgi:signal transduction histidine kinase/ligand-binding sensor domain-containing protein/DNA-binding response OmpR family regulator
MMDQLPWKYYNFFSLLAILFLPLIIQAQQSGVLFNHYDIRNGLIMNNVEYIDIDREGFVWLGTSAGLQRFDGYEFRDYTFDPEDTSSISDNFISTIFEDDSANLWVGTSVNGLNVFNKELGAFRTFRHNPENKKSLVSNRIPRAKKVITQDGEGYVWVNFNVGLNRIDLRDFSFESFYGDFSGQLIFDKSESAIWIAGDQLKKFDLKSRKLSYYESGPLTSIILDSEGNLWLGTRSGAWIFNKSTNEITPFQEYLKRNGYQDWNNKILDGEGINNFYEDNQGNIWFSIGHRLVNLNRAQRKIDILVHEPDNENSPKEFHISGIYGNKSGVIWISYNNHGVSKVNINPPKKFNVYSKVPGDPNSLSGNTIRSIFVDQKKYLWVGTYDNGLNRITPRTETISHYRPDPGNPASIVSDYIVALYVDNLERLWVGSYIEGLCYSDNIYEPGQLEFTSKGIFKDIEIHEFTEDRAGRIWISTNKGFYIYDHRDDVFRHYGDLDGQLPKVKDLNIQSVVFQPPDLFWMATWNAGICRLFLHSDTLLSPHPGKDSLIILDQLVDQYNIRIDNKFITIHRTEDGDLWLGSYLNGLIRISETAGGLEFLRYDKSAGAPDNSVLGIASDKQGNIWISTNRGLGRFNPDLEQFRNYDMSDGLHSHSFIWDAAFKDHDGRLYFGGSDGLNAFYPEDITVHDDLPEVFISKLIINNEDVRIGDEFKGKVLLNKDIRYTDEITLTRRESVFSLEFTAMDIINPMEVLYRYKLEGFDEDWIQTSAEERSVRYTNLNAGTYIFHVKASNSDGIWNEDPATLKIIILGPWWKSWWAIVIYSILFALLLITFRKFILVRAQLIHEAKMEHLEREKTEEMYQMKLRFFTSISHEFRTPLTLILGPLQKIISSLENDTRFTRQIHTIKRNSDRLFRLIDQVIEFRRIETNKIIPYASKGDIVSFVRELVDSFEEIACQRTITLDFHSEMENCNIWFDVNKVDKIIYNLLSNAFKFTPDKGHIRVGLSPASTNPSEGTNENTDPALPVKFLPITIEDNGIGIAENDLEHIFDRYFRVDNPDSFLQTGSGIGLSLAKELTELHKGQIKVSSRLGKGTCFTLYLPHGKDHLSEEEIVNKSEKEPGTDFSLKQFALTDEHEYIASYEPVQPQLDLGERPLLMIVDDDQELRDFIKNNFNTDYIVIEAENGQEGFEMALKNNPDIIISDIMMPVMDGIELCRKLKSDIKTSHIPIILLTAKAGVESRIEGLDTGANAYIAKPFTTKLIEVQIHNILKNRENLRKKFSKELVLQPSDIAITSLDEEFLQKAINTVEEHISDTEFSVDSFIKEIGMSRSRMHRKIKALTALSTSEFIRTIRLKRAASLLEKSQLSIEEIAYAVGFNSTAYFTKCFKIQFGKTPSDYMRSLSF